VSRGLRCADLISLEGAVPIVRGAVSCGSCMVQILQGDGLAPI
jgi:hypothetical protein